MVDIATNINKKYLDQIYKKETNKEALKESAKFKGSYRERMEVEKIIKQHRKSKNHESAWDFNMRITGILAIVCLAISIIGLIIVNITRYLS